MLKGSDFIDEKLKIFKINFKGKIKQICFSEKHLFFLDENNLTFYKNLEKFNLDD